MKRANQKPVESVADFKARIAVMINRGKSNIIPLRHTPRLLVRVPGDRGYDPPPRSAE
jgi:hypothetical protein